MLTIVLILGLRPTESGRDIVFTDVHFKYPARPDVPILQGLSLTIKKGETVALVGTSGCGKSTCIQLLERFYDSNEGRILIDGKPINTLNLKWLRQQVGFVQQGTGHLQIDLQNQIML